MTLISKGALSLCVFLVLLGLPLAGVFAQTPQRLSVSPTLFEMSATPGQEWRSSIKIINPNPYPLQVYASVVNFAPKGEGGDGTLLPVLENEQNGATLAEWVTYASDPITISPEQVYELPFTVRIPESAPPGGHFAAFLVGTKPPDGVAGATQLRTSQVVTSLFFVRVAGDVVEAGAIREFGASAWFYSRPEATLNVRFENKGNVHLRPQGDITIYNMWGQERGVVPINRQSHFGNVLPESIRKFTFTWRGEWSFSDIGRYRAVVTLAYGQDARQFVSSTAYFWVIPLVPVVITLTAVGALVFALIWLIRLYVRRMLEMAGVAQPPQRPYVRRDLRRGDLVMRTSLQPAADPEALTSAQPNSAQGNYAVIMERVAHFKIWSLIRHHSLAFGVGVLLVCSVLVGLLLRPAFTPQRSYEVTYEGPGNTTSVTSDQILFEKNRTPGTATNAATSSTPIAVVNRSGQAGVASQVALMLEEQGYTIAEVRTDMEDTQGRTVVVYSASQTETALALSKLLNNALLSAATNTPSNITVYVGVDVGEAE